MSISLHIMTNRRNYAAFSLESTGRKWLLDVPEEYGGYGVPTYYSLMKNLLELVFAHYQLLFLVNCCTIYFTYWN